MLDALHQLEPLARPTVAILFNGLWQGALIVVIGYLCSHRVPAKNSTTRYAIWFVALLALGL